MPVLKCKICGGTVSVLNDSATGKCDYCGTVMTIPRVNDDRVANLFNRANHYRMQGDFDRAITTYENILAEDNSNAEAHWCAVLCRFGVEYVDDPYTHKKVATCHRTNHASVFSDADYQDAIRYADPIAKELYETEAQQINEIQKGILKVSQAEEPYDIFISYKESDISGARTKDSVIAQDLYLRLTQEGYRVFFSRISLEDKIGRQYEPYIFSALNSAKVMLLIGTCQEHFNAPWVKNEWSRFLKLAQDDSSRILIPCYRDMDIYDLPEELSILQCQDMSKIGFEQDLLHGIQKYFKFGRNQHPVNERNTLEHLLGNAETYLELDNYPLAEKTYRSATEQYPSDYRGWWGLLVCGTRNFSETTLNRSEYDRWFRYVKKLAPPNEYRKLSPLYNDYIKKISPMAAEQRMEAVREENEQHKNEIGHIQAQIQTLQEKIASSGQKRNNLERKLNTDYQSQCNSCEEKIKELTQRCEKFESALQTEKIGKYVLGGGICCPILYSSFFIGFLPGLIVGAILIAVGYAMCLPARKIGANDSVLKRCQSEQQRELENFGRLKQDWARVLKQQLEAHDTDILDCQQNVLPANQRLLLEHEELLQAGEAYLARGIEANADEWFERQWEIVSQ